MISLNFHYTYTLLSFKSNLLLSSPDTGNDADVEMVPADSSLNSDVKSRPSKKKRKEKHRYSPEPSPDGANVERKRKRKKKSFDHENWQVAESLNLPQPHVPKIKVHFVSVLHTVNV